MVIKQIELLRWKYVYPGWLYLHNKENLFSLYPTYKPIYNIFAKNKLNYIHGASGKFAVPNTARATSHKARNTPGHHPSWECQHDTRTFHKNEFKEGLMVNTSEWRMCFCKHISTIYIYIYIYICVCVCVCMYICMCVYICVRIYVLCVCIRICLCTYMLHSASMSQIHRTLNRFLCGFICVSLCQSIKIKPPNMYIASARAQFKINTHRCWNWHHVHSRQVVSCPVQPRARHWSCVFWRDFSGVKRTCWTTGSWRSCLSLEVVSSIPAWSTIFIGSFVGLYAFPCARASKLNHQICISPAPGRSSKLTHTGVEIDTMCIPDRLSVVQCSHGHVIGVAFFGAISVAWSVRAGQLAAGGVASVWRSWVRSPPGPRYLSVPLWVYMRFPVPEHQN